MAAELQKLLKEMEPLTYEQRVKRMFTLGVMARQDNANARERDAARQLIAQLWSGSFYERHLAVITAHGSRNAGLVFEACVSESAMLRKKGLRMAAAICDDAQLERLFAVLQEKQQRELLKDLRRLRKTSLAERLVDSLRTESMDKYVNVFFFASEDYVRKNLDAVIDRIGTDHMARFAYQHPKVAAEFLILQHKQAVEADPRLTWLTNAALPTLTELMPKDALEVVSHAVRTVPAQSLSYYRLMYRFPNELIALLHTQKALVSSLSWSRLEKMSAQTFEILLNANVLNGSSQNSMGRVNAKIAETVYASAAEGWRNPQGCLSTVFVDRLPEELRVKEARRHLSNPVIEANEQLRLSFAKYLPWAEALELVRPLIDGPDVDLRASGFAALVPAVRFHRADRTHLLALLQRRKNEPDPVGMSIWTQLRTLPPSMWTGADLESLDSLINSSLSAADLSYNTVANIAMFLFCVYPFHSKWAGERLGKLLRERGMVGSRPLSLAKHQFAELNEHLKPAVKYWLAREETHHLVALATLYRKRTFDFPELVQALTALALRGTNERDAMSAVYALKTQAYPIFTEVVPQLLKRDHSWATKPVIYEYLHRRRQDLLTPYLGQTNHKGLFHQGKSRLVPSFMSGFYRWTRDQQRIHERELLLISNESSGDVGHRLFGVHRLVRMPEPPIEALRKLASTTSNNASDSAVRDAVISNLGNLDSAQGIPLLLEALNDERARVAIYALKSIPKTMAPDRAMELFNGVSSQQITVRKEVLRLIGLLKSKAALDRLLAEWQAEQHKDVRTAIVRALWNFTDEDRAWDVFSEASQSADAGTVDTALRIPVEKLDAKGRSRLLNLYVRAMQSTTPRTRCNAVRWANHLPILDREQILLPPLIACMRSESNDESNLAAACAVRLYAQRVPATMPKIIASLSENKRSLLRFLNSLEVMVRTQRERLMDAGLAADAELARHPLLLTRRLQFAGVVLGWNDFGALLRQLDAAGALHADALAAAGAAFRCISHRTDDAELLALETELAKEKSELLRRLGLRALVALAEDTRSGWSRELLDKLLKYRDDRSNLVASAAHLTLPVNELQPAIQGA